jgi:hypothetical protein
MTIAAFSDKVRGQAPSTSISTVVVASIATVSNTTYVVKASVRAVNTTSTLMRSYTLVASFVNKAGTLTQVGTTTTLSDNFESSVLAGVPTFNISGTTIQLLSNQSQSVNITWDALLESDAYTYA